MCNTLFLRAATMAAAFVSTSLFLSAHDNRPGPQAWGHTSAVFTMNNAPEGNRILVFDRLPDGRLRSSDSFPTGGLGTGGGLGNQSGLVASGSGRWLFAVNAGSAEVSMFEVVGDVLILRDIVPSGGATPISVTENRGLVYVLNAGSGPEDPDNITGFIIDRDEGRLLALSGSTRALSGDSVGPAQIGFDPWGNVLVVTEKATNTITTFAVDDDGLPGTANSQVSAGATPFGFAFDRRGTLIVSEAFGGAADASAVSSYRVDTAGTLSVITASAPTTETAACWIVIDKWGRHAYTTNFGSGSISGYAISRSGALSLLDADGVTGSPGAGSGPLDMSVTDDGRFLYSLNAGNGTITGFRIGPNGSLTLVETETGIPAGSNGLVAR